MERVFIGNPDVSAVFRLLKAAREGKAAEEGWHCRPRRAPMAGGSGCGCVRSARASARGEICGAVADITRDRERQEDVFKEPQHAIEYLDQRLRFLLGQRFRGDCLCQ